MLQPPAATFDAPRQSIAALLKPPKHRGFGSWRNWAAIGLSLAILIAIGIKARDVDFGKILSMAPGLSLFWPVFVLHYVLTPASHWVIYRRLWRLPAAGITPLLGKQVANEVVVGYAGEAHFYFWAQRHAGLTGSPFGAIKDVAVLSAVAGNIATLALMIVMAPMLASFMSGPLASTFAWSVAVIVTCSLIPWLFRRRLFSLGSRDLYFIFAVHMMRVGAFLILSAAMWHFMLPQIAVGTWLSLATLRMMISRLPLIANKEILFAAATMLLLGQNNDVAVAVAFTASLTLVAHLAVGAVTGGAAFIERRRAA